MTLDQPNDEVFEAESEKRESATKGKYPTLRRLPELRLLTAILAEMVDDEVFPSVRMPRPFQEQRGDLHRHS